MYLIVCIHWLRGYFGKIGLRHAFVYGYFSFFIESNPGNLLCS